MASKKIRTLISLLPEEKEILEEYANEENRSFNNYVVNILLQHIKERQKKE